jgi:hypothetical protein
MVRCRAANGRAVEKEDDVSAGAFVMAIIIVVMVAIALYLIVTMARSIRIEAHKSRLNVWRNFGLSIALCVLFLLSWVGQGLAQWQEFTDTQREHGEPVEAGDFVAEFSSATLENWQSEFLQLFSFVVLSALLIHKGSAESKDSGDRMEAALKRIEKQLEELQGS